MNVDNGTWTNITWPQVFNSQLHLAAVFAMISIVLATLIGNTLVIVSVFTNRTLRTVTNYFVVSLAFADLFVALTVLPFHIVHYITIPRWIFGKVICVWFTSMDVLLCTASIWNLCAISLDRYLAITRPLVYATRRSKRLAVTIIAAAWALSALVTCPCIVIQYRTNMNKTCELPHQKTYIVYSALGSFYVPLFIMIAFYSQIFIVAKRSSRRQLTATENANNSPVTGGHRLRVCLHACIGDLCCDYTAYERRRRRRGHRGHAGHEGHGDTEDDDDEEEEEEEEYDDDDDVIGKRGGRQLHVEFLRRMSDATLRYDTVLDDVVSDVVSEDDTGFCGGGGGSGGGGGLSTDPESSTTGGAEVGADVARSGSKLSERSLAAGVRTTPSFPQSFKRVSLGMSLQLRAVLASSGTPPQSPRHAKCKVDRGAGRGHESPKTSKLSFVKISLAKAESCCGGGSTGAGGGGSTGAGGATRKRNLNSMKKEAKTAKTLAVVVGCFTVCWLPFSVLYVLGLVMKVNEMAMLLATWLGYLNSVVNPFIYAFYNRDFLTSFKRLTIGACTGKQASRYNL